MKKNGGLKSINLTVVTAGLLIFITGIAALLRFYEIGKLSFWKDEIDTMGYATLGLGSLLHVVFTSDPNMSLYYLLVHYWIQLLPPNPSEGPLRALSALFSVASIPVVFSLGKALGANRKQAVGIGLVAAILTTINAYSIQYSQELRSYSLVFLLAALSTLLLIKAIERPDSTLLWIGYVLVSAAAYYSQFFMGFMLIAQAVSLLVLFLGNRHTFPLKRAAGSYVAIGVIIAPVTYAAFKVGTAATLGWVLKPTFDSVRNFATELAGNQGPLLLDLYLFLGSIGLLVGVGEWLGKDLVIKWKYTLMASCLFLTVAVVLVFSLVKTPIFVDRYLLFILPYLAILAATGIVTLASLGYKSRENLIITIPLGITALVLMIGLSATGIKSYFDTYQKEDWRDVAQLLAEKCPMGLHLYDRPYLEQMAVYYNANLESQVTNWSKFLSKDSSSKTLAKLLPNGYKQACLVVAEVGTPKYEAQLKVIQAAIRMKFPEVTEYKFQGRVEVFIYEAKKH
jgi:uncharacterized membrane protein